MLSCSASKPLFLLPFVDVEEDSDSYSSPSTLPPAAFPLSSAVHSVTSYSTRTFPSCLCRTVLEVCMFPKRLPEIRLSNHGILVNSRPISTCGRGSGTVVGATTSSILFSVSSGSKPNSSSLCRSWVRRLPTVTWIYSASVRGCSVQYDMGVPQKPQNILWACCSFGWA